MGSQNLDSATQKTPSKSYRESSKEKKESKHKQCECLSEIT